MVSASPGVSVVDTLSVGGWLLAERKTEKLGLAAFVSPDPAVVVVDQRAVPVLSQGLTDVGKHQSTFQSCWPLAFGVSTKREAPLFCRAPLRASRNPSR